MRETVRLFVNKLQLLNVDPVPLELNFPYEILKYKQNTNVLNVELRKKNKHIT